MTALPRPQPDTHAVPGFLRRLRLAWIALNQPPRQLILYAVVCAALLLIFASLPGGFDYKGYFDQMARGGYDRTYNPYFTAWFLRPLGLIDGWRPAYLVWLAVTMALIWPTARALGGSPFVMIFSPATLWIFWLGQIDILAVGGLALAWWSLERDRRVLMGLGLLLMATKPQLTGLLILALIWWGGPRALLIPVLAAALSFALYGPDWPLRWLSYTPQTVFAGDAWFYLSPLWLLPTALGVFWVAGRARQMQYLLAATLAGGPYLGAYSFFALAAFPLRWWEVAAGVLPFAVVGLTGQHALLGLLVAQPLLVMARLIAPSVLRRPSADS